MEPDRVSTTIAAALSHYFAKFAAKARSLTAGLTEEEFWTKPYPYGNSAGHLLLHITGNLSYYIGTSIAGTGYVRNRPLEFTDTSRRPKEDVLTALEDAVAMVVRTIEAQKPDDWVRGYEAHGMDDPTRLSALLHCASHFDHHLGQIIYLVKEHERKRA